MKLSKPVPLRISPKKTIQAMTLWLSLNIMMKCKFPINCSLQLENSIKITFRYEDEEQNVSGNFSDEWLNTDPITYRIMLYWMQGSLVMAVIIIIIILIIIIIILIIIVAAWLIHKRWKIKDKETIPPLYWCK